jgi:hypothetical protein
MKKNSLQKLTTFLGDLEQHRIYYTLAHHRDEAVMVTVSIPGERWEVEFFVDGAVEVERFFSTGSIAGPELLTELFTNDLTADEFETSVLETGENLPLDLHFQHELLPA